MTWSQPPQTKPLSLVLPPNHTFNNMCVCVCAFLRVCVLLNFRHFLPQRHATCWTNFPTTIKWFTRFNVGINQFYADALVCAEVVNFPTCLCAESVCVCWARVCDNVYTGWPICFVRINIFVANIRCVIPTAICAFVAQKNLITGGTVAKLHWIVPTSVCALNAYIQLVP